MYSVPDRLVQACLQVTEQVWQPMHLSRFITIAICAMTFIAAPRRRWSSRPSVTHLLAAATHYRHLVALVSGGPHVVEGERVLAVSARQVARFDPHPGQRIVVAAPLSGGLGARGVHGAFLDVVDEDHALGHALGHDRPAHEHPVDV